MQIYFSTEQQLESVCKKKQIRWGNYSHLQHTSLLEDEHINSAYITLKQAYNSWFRKDFSQYVEATFFKSINNAYMNCSYKLYTTEYLDKRVENHYPLNVYGKDLKEAFPHRCRPENYDIDALEYFVSTQTAIPPVIIALFKDRQILLDGNHRCVAAAILGSKVKAFVITQ